MDQTGYASLTAAGPVSTKPRCFTWAIDWILLVLDHPEGEIMLKQYVMAAASAVVIGLSPIATAADVVVVIINHEVADFTAWKKGFDAGKDNRDKAGVSDRYVVRDLDRRNFVTIVLEFGTLENAKKYVSDPALKERMKKAGVIGVPDITIGTTGAVGEGK